MRLPIAIALCLWAAQFSGTVSADLYRWIDPQSGSVKYSSYPPPWYGEPAHPRRAPKVELIPAGRKAPAQTLGTTQPGDAAKEQVGAKPRPPAAEGETGTTAEAESQER